MTVPAGAGRSRVIIVTGPCQAGKSTVLSVLASLLRSRGMKIAGFIARGLWYGGRRAGFDLVDLADGRTVPLCRRTAYDELIDGIPYDFVDSGIEAGLKALSVSRCAGAHFIFVDEVGTLEIRGLGWAKCLAPLLELDGPVQIWVVRAGCVEEVRRKWGLDRVAVVRVDGPDVLNRLLAACLEQMGAKSEIS